MQYSIEQRPGYVLTSFSGTGTAEEVKSAFLEALGVAEDRALSAIVIDSRESRVHPGVDAMRDLANFAMELHRSGLPRTALLVQGPLQYGLARMFSAFVEFSGWEFRIFREIESAEAWIRQE